MAEIQQNMKQNDGMSPYNTNIYVYELIWAGRVVKIGIYQKKVQKMPFSGFLTGQNHLNRHRFWNLPNFKLSKNGDFMA